MTPFEAFWKLYSSNCMRMKNKKNCEKKFNKHPIELQRVIYKDVRDRIKHYPDWKDPQYVCAPEVYLNQAYWDNPVQKIKRQSSVRDTTNIVENLAQKRLGLEKLRDMLLKNGGEVAHLDNQIAAL